MNLGTIIKNYRIKHDLSLRDFSKKCDLSYTYISMLEKGSDYRNNKPLSPTLDAINKIASGLNISLEELLKIMDNQEINFQNKAPSFENNFNKHAFPLLGTVKAGYNYLAAENIIGYVSIDTDINDAENCYALKVTGNSMQPILYEDDIIIIHKQSDVESGQTAIVLINNDEATVKKVVKYDNYIELIAFNPYYPSKKLTNADNFKIIGKVIEARITKIFE